MLNAKWITKNQNTRLYQIPVPIVGLTGGIATGKSTVADLFRKKNIPVIDADKLVKNIYQKTATVEFVKNNYPDVMENGAIIFPKLRELAFSTPEVKKKLEEYIYALLPSEFTNAFTLLPSAPFIVYDVPLMFERGLEAFIDCTICVYSPSALQIERLMKRDGINEDLAKNILNQQMNIEDKKSRANLVITNIGSLGHLEADFESSFSKLTI
jgi:dephospho-CoA kinase